MTSMHSSWVARRRVFRPSDFPARRQRREGAPFLALLGLALLLLLAGPSWRTESHRSAQHATAHENRDAGARWRVPPRGRAAEEYRAAYDLRGFFERHRDAADDPPTAYFLSQALEECFAVSRALPMHREDWVPAGGASAWRWMELAAAEELAAPCRGFEDRRIESAEVMRLLEQAAQSGDARARARMLLFRDIAAPKDDVIASLPELLATGDPMVVRDVGAYLARGESHWRLGGRDVPVASAVIAWELAACDLGYDCGPSSRIVLAQCAFAGNCGAASHEDVLARTETPERLLEGLQLRSRLVGALRQHDWVWLGLMGSDSN